jgi:hypothetical protein
MFDYGSNFYSVEVSAWNIHDLSANLRYIFVLSIFEDSCKKETLQENPSFAEVETAFQTRISQPFFYWIRDSFT